MMEKLKSLNIPRLSEEDVGLIKVLLTATANYVVEGIKAHERHDNETKKHFSKAKSDTYEEMRDIFTRAGVPEVPKPTGLKKISGEPAGTTTLPERLALALSCWAACEIRRSVSEEYTGKLILHEVHVNEWLEEAEADLNDGTKLPRIS